MGSMPIYEMSLHVMFFMHPNALMCISYQVSLKSEYGYNITWVCLCLSKMCYLAELAACGEQNTLPSNAESEMNSLA